MSETVIRIPQEFSVEKAWLFRDEVRSLIEEGTLVFMLDFSDCAFIDSTGLGVIVSSYKKCVEAGGNIRLKSLSPNVMNVFQLTRLNHVFEILP
ncbi:STAS domain-containing protein [Paenibacillus sp. HN-1]|uniref:STAS domain-containing protein n=1 Tax=Paenibacillus TaxID=44249 RepID=UPI001CA8048C|nr:MULTISPECIES: STAS domain-containing protein [Paenibacillus]MBY9079229.1 STAS domain-containing protein [Paenibacillus sp. CGMCC 1.18879]MBY9086952.1 STAS domain-containing protein [Paenibacillus sinensis]